ncbi:hypothetical protein PGB90_003339 [Kerria lacca]
MTSKQFRVKKAKPPPFPYEKKKYNLVRSLFDKTFKRFDENTKLIVIEGPIAAGKNKLAKIIADEFEMKYVPDVTLDDYYINPYGYDMRNLDYKLPLKTQSFDEKKFCLDPFHINVCRFQVMKYMLRFSSYWDSLNHILNTGQGVVTVRSPFSDINFMNAMKECKYISPQARIFYLEIVRHTIMFLYRPHLIIYLDVPVNDTIQNIKKRNIPHEVNSKALTSEFHHQMALQYRNFYIPEASLQSKMLIYNWVDEGEPEVVIEDIQQINFDEKLKYDDLLLSDWKVEEDEIDLDRVRYSTKKEQTMSIFGTICCYDAPEMFVDYNDYEVYEQVWKSANEFTLDFTHFSVIKFLFNFAYKI